MPYRWIVKGLTKDAYFRHGRLTKDAYFRTKKDMIDCLKEIYLNDHVPFFELDSQGRLNGFTFKEFLTDFKIIKI
jgi:hypothetical protein